jgi:hypothetical protein
MEPPTTHPNGAKSGAKLGHASSSSRAASMQQLLLCMWVPLAFDIIKGL